jgi:hypothetical protein
MIGYLGGGNGIIHITRDGGRSWQETRVRTPRSQRFVGSIRATGSASAPGLKEVLNPTEPRPSTVIDRRSLFDTFLSSKQQPFNPNLLNPDEMAQNHFDLGLSPGREGSPWLTLALRRKRKWETGINIKQTLSLFAKPPTLVVWLDVHPDDPNDVLAATHDGLLRSRDGGAPGRWSTPAPRDGDGRSATSSKCSQHGNLCSFNSRRLSKRRSVAALSLPPRARSSAGRSTQTPTSRCACSSTHTPAV